ncbi:MAG: hypothetical protein WCQ99_12815, partial [Pseudomonadota bacterium]
MREIKKILIDPGGFYTKVQVLRRPGENGGEASARGGEFYGRTFFPTLVSAAGAIDKDRMYYEHEALLYSVGYDCCRGLDPVQLIKVFNTTGASAAHEAILLKKIIFDYADTRDELEIEVVVDSPLKEQLFSEVREMLQKDPLQIKAFRAFDRRSIEKQ